MQNGRDRDDINTTLPSPALTCSAHEHAARQLPRPSKRSTECARHVRAVSTFGPQPEQVATERHLGYAVCCKPAFPASAYDRHRPRGTAVNSSSRKSSSHCPEYRQPSAFTQSANMSQPVHNRSTTSPIAVCSQERHWACPSTALRSSP